MRQLHYVLLLGAVACLVWVGLNHIHGDELPTVCLFKQITSLPCPACGSTRAVLLFLNGDIVAGLSLNPLGPLTMLLALAAGTIALRDIAAGKNDLTLAWHRFERMLKQRSAYVPLILLVTANWFWNVMKGL